MQRNNTVALYWMTTPQKSKNNQKWSILRNHQTVIIDWKAGTVGLWADVQAPEARKHHLRNKNLFTTYSKRVNLFKWRYKDRWYVTKDMPILQQSGGKRSQFVMVPSNEKERTFEFWALQSWLCIHNLILLREYRMKNTYDWPTAVVRI